MGSDPVQNKTIYINGLTTNALKTLFINILIYILLFYVTKSFLFSNNALNITTSLVGSYILTVSYEYLTKCQYITNCIGFPQMLFSLLPMYVFAIITLPSMLFPKKV